MRKIIKILLFTFVILTLTTTLVFAHSGRTDGSGGHRDTRNASGLGGYHYHHGMGPHLHQNGNCPYSQNSNTITVPSDTIEISNMPTSLSIGETAYLVWDVTYYSGNGNVDFISSDPSIITVMGRGVLKAVKPGTVTITAKMQNGSERFTVIAKTVNANNVSITNKPTQLQIGDISKLTVKVEPAYTTNPSVEWSSSNKEVATIDNSGRLSAIKVGFTSIIAKTINGKKDEFLLTVFEIPPEKIETNLSELSLIIGESEKISAKVIPDKIINDKIEWSSLDPQIATVDQNGNIESIGVGTTKVIAAFQSIQKEIPVEVTAIKTESMVLNIDSIPFFFNGLVNVGETFEPEIELFPNNITYPSYTLTTNAPNIIMIDGTKVKTIKSGRATLIITSDEVSTEISMMVINIKTFFGTSGILGLTGIVGYTKLRKKQEV